MLHGFFKPAWQSKSSEKRRSSVLKMNSLSVENQIIFSKLARQDPSLAVQLECIKKLQNPSVLFELYSTANDEQLKCAAKDRLRSSITSSSPEARDSLTELLQKHPASSYVLIEHAPFPELRHELVANAHEIDLAHLIANVSFSDTRHVIAEHLHSFSALELARKNLKGKDKKAERTLRTKLDDLRQKQKQIDVAQSAANELISNMAFIANHPQWRSEFKGRFEHYLARWKTLESLVSDATVNAFMRLKNTAQEKVDDQKEQERTQEQQLVLLNNLENYCCNTLAGLSLEDLKKEQIHISTLLVETISSWLELNKNGSVKPAMSQRFLTAERALEWLTTLLSENPKPAFTESHWPSNYPTLIAYPDISNQYQQRALETNSAITAYNEGLTQLHQRLNRLMRTTQQGNLRKAKHELDAVTQIIGKYKERDRAQLEGRLLKAQENVQKMEDWHLFATEPKLVALCEQMEALANSKIHADALAEKIAKAHKKWKSLGHSDAADSHWPRFKAASDLAYKPCTDFFKQRKDIQKNNLQKREPLINQLTDLLQNTQWQDQVDYKHLEHTLKDIDTKWRAIKDVERKAGQRQWHRLTKIKDQIQAHLDPVYDANINLKHTLMGHVEQLHASEVNENSLDKLKSLQRQWKAVGITRRQQDQALWKQFKYQSDAVYEKISALRSKVKANEESQLKRYKGIIQDMTILAHSAQSIAQIDRDSFALQQQYNSLPPLPSGLHEKHIERLNHDYRRVEAKLSTTRDSIISKIENEQFAQLKHKASLCSEVERIINSPNTNAQVDTLRSQIADLVLAEKKWENDIQNRLALATNRDKKNANEQRRRLCTALEILNNIDSPIEDKPLRMAMQLERLQQQGLIASTHDNKHAIKDIEVQWYTLEGAEPSLQNALQRRFEKALS